MQNTKQRGGTLLGIVIGLVIGLGIALGVALMITKTPMPFTNKLARPEKTPEAGTPPADPNRPLYGKAAREASKAAAEPAPANTAAPPAENKPQVVELSNLPKKQEAKPAETKAADAKTAAEDDKWSYYLQAGAFREQGDAEGLRAKLALMGVEARLSERQSENGTLYRVRIGPFNQLDAMNRVRTKLSDNGVDAAVVRTSKQ